MRNSIFKTILVGLSLLLLINCNGQEKQMDTIDMDIGKSLKSDIDKVVNSQPNLKENLDKVMLDKTFSVMSPETIELKISNKNWDSLRLTFVAFLGNWDDAVYAKAVAHYSDFAKKMKPFGLQVVLVTTAGNNLTDENLIIEVDSNHSALAEIDKSIEIYPTWSDLKTNESEPIGHQYAILIGQRNEVVKVWSSQKFTDFVEPSEVKQTYFTWVFDIKDGSALRPYNKLNEFEEYVIAQKGTERPFTGEYFDSKAEGIYTCRRCNAPLYWSGDKFDSHCGWPSFDDEIEGMVTRTLDADGRRTEITCTTCDGHLGHVFEGEHLTDKNIRHCVNSVSIKVQPIIK